MEDMPRGVENRRALTGQLRELWSRRDLLLAITRRDIRVRYVQSVMGVLWAVLMPALVVIAGILVRVALAKIQDRPPQPMELVSVSVRSLPWAFLVSAIRFGTNSLLSNESLVAKIYFPKEVFPLAAMLSSLFDLAVAAAALAIVLGLAGVSATVHILWVPPLLAVLVLFATGLALLLSAANLFYRDVKYLVEVALTFGIFFTPVFYETALFGPWGRLILLNPAAVVLESLGTAVVSHRAPDPLWLSYAAFVSLVVCATGYRLFKRLEPRFAEVI